MIIIIFLWRHVYYIIFIRGRIGRKRLRDLFRIISLQYHNIKRQYVTECNIIIIIMIILYVLLSWRIFFRH